MTVHVHAYLGNTALLAQHRQQWTAHILRMEVLRLVTIHIGLLISIPVFFIGMTIRLFKRGRALLTVKTRTSPPPCLMDPR